MFNYIVCLFVQTYMPFGPKKSKFAAKVLLFFELCKFFFIFFASECHFCFFEGRHRPDNVPIIYRISIVYLTYIYRVSIVYLSYIYRISIVYLSYIYRISIVYLSYIYRISIVFRPKIVRD